MELDHTQNSSSDVVYGPVAKIGIPKTVGCWNRSSLVWVSGPHGPIVGFCLR